MDYSTPESKAAISHDFGYHPPKGIERTRQHEDVRAELAFTAKVMDRLLPPGREKALVRTKLEEAMFWANAAVARQTGEG